jgi:hypothetical protein
MPKQQIVCANKNDGDWEALGRPPLPFCIHESVPKNGWFDGDPEKRLS